MNPYITKLPHNYKIKYKGKDGLQAHHLIPGTANRKWSDYYGLVVYVTQTAHEWYHRNILESRKQGQAMFEQFYTRKQFIKTFGQNYL